MIKLFGFFTDLSLWHPGSKAILGQKVLDLGPKDLDMVMNKLILWWNMRIDRVQGGRVEQPDWMA